MELVRVKSSPGYRSKKNDRLVVSNQAGPISILRTLQNDNVLIKRKLKEIETRLSRVSEDQDKILTGTETVSVEKISSLRPKTAGLNRTPMMATEPPSSSNLLDKIRERYASTSTLLVDSRPKTAICRPASRRISSASSSLNLDKILENLNRQRLNSSASRKSLIDEANESGGGPKDEPVEEELPRSSPKMERPKTAVPAASTEKKKYRHMFYSGTWSRVHSELFNGHIDRLAPRDRNMVMFQDVRKKWPETFIFHPEWV